MPFDPDAYLSQTSPKADAPFNPDAYLNPETEKSQPAPSTPDYSPMESAGMGALQGATLGFADEAQGGIDALLSKTGNLFVPEGGQNPYEGKSISDTYQQGRNEARDSYKAAEQANPKSFTTGAIVGGLALPGGGIKTLAAQGAVAGLGASDKETAGGQLADTAIGGVIGGVAGKAGELLGKGLQAAKESNLAQGMATKVAGLVGDLPEEFAKKIIENPKLGGPKSFEKISDDVVGAANQLRGEIGHFDSKAWATLSDAPTIAPEAAKSIVKQSMVEAGVLKPLPNGSFSQGALGQDKLAVRKAQEILHELNNYDNKMSEKDLKTLIQKIDKETNWDKEEFEVANNLLMNVRTKLDDVLKTNEGYKTAMEPVSQKIQALDNLRKNFRLRKDGGEGYAATDTTLSKLKTLSDDTAKLQSMKPNTQKAVEDVNPAILSDLESNRMFRTADQDITRGSKSTTGGAITGASLGAAISPALAPVGAAAGWLAGAARDKYGRKVATEGLKTAAPALKAVDQSVQKIAGLPVDTFNKLPDKYKNVLQKAAQQGGRSAAITHFLLSQEDKDYQNALK